MDPLQPLPPTIDARFELLAPVGRGGQAETWRARDTTDDTIVALKIVRLADLRGWKDLDLFEREVDVLRHLDHPDIPRYVEALRLEDPDHGHTTLALAQSFVEGPTLRQVLEQTPAGAQAMDAAQVRDLLRKMLAILDYLHHLQPPIVHRDIKPDNIIRRDDGRYSLVDFGAVQATLPHSRGGSTFVGTAGYIAPEQLMGRAQPASDLYGLAVTAVELLTHISPLDWPRRGMHLLDVGELLEGRADPALVDLLTRMLAADPTERPTTAAEALAALERTLPASRTALVRPPETLVDRLRLDRRGALVLTLGRPTIGIYYWPNLILSALMIASLILLGSAPLILLIVVLVLIAIQLYRLAGRTRIVLEGARLGVRSAGLPGMFVGSEWWDLQEADVTGLAIDEGAELVLLLREGPYQQELEWTLDREALAWLCREALARRQGPRSREER